MKFPLVVMTRKRLEEAHARAENIALNTGAQRGYRAGLEVALIALKKCGQTRALIDLWRRLVTEVEDEMQAKQEAEQKK